MLRSVIDGIRSSTSVVEVKLDGVDVVVQYDDARVQRSRLHQILTALGHAPVPETDLREAALRPLQHL
jgi:hypothetical protein